MSAQKLQNRLDALRSYGIDVPEDRAAEWLEELKTGSGRGRSFDQLWADILKHHVAPQTDALEAWVKEQFGNEQVDPKRMERLINELVSGKRTFSDMAEDIRKATKQSKNTQGEDPNDPNDLKIMGGKHQWYKTKTGDWYVAYQAPGNQWVYFEVAEEEMDAIFGDDIRPNDFEAIKSEADLARQKKYHYGGTVAEITGDGNFQHEAQKALERALADGALPDWLEGSASEEVMGLIYISQTQDKGPDWLMDQISKTKAFKQRYQGIDNFRDQGLSWTEAVGAYRQYEGTLKEMFKRMGKDVSVTPTRIKQYLDQGHSVDDVKFVYESFDHLDNNQDAFKSFNDLLEAQGMKRMTKKDQMAFLQGKAPAELYQTWEEFSVLHEARQAGVGNYMTAQEAVELAQRTAGIETQDSIAQGMQQAAALALRYRAQLDVEKYGLTGDDIIDMSMGLKPRSGKTQAELTQVMQKISAEAEGFLKQQSTPFIGFTPEGRPGARSLGGLRQEGI